ncbi:MAG: hypothetical protein ISS93_03200 [Candidatus Aenigmarchaeota archaeon]|nr:hypothetical protein [Candidatus Aenigmarchaeota archaeon]
MRVLIQGSGGREYALALHASEHGHYVTVSPGNPAIKIMGIGDTVPYTDPEGFAKYFEENGFELGIAGPEDPLKDGLGDIMHDRQLPFFGPKRAHAKAEWSKGYLAELLKGTGLMPKSGYFKTSIAAMKYLNANWHTDLNKLVIKSNELRAGKGVILPNSLTEATDAVDGIMAPPPHGLGDDCLIQDRLYGIELSSMVIAGQGDCIQLPSSIDNKPVGMNNFGLDPKLNTGGMGAESPHPHISEKEFEKLLETHTVPLVDAVENDAAVGGVIGLVYNGMIKQEKNGPTWKSKAIKGKKVKILESNLGRFGDPEAQPVLMRVRSDLAKYMLAATHGQLDSMPPLEIDPRHAVYVVMATPGYPTSEYKKQTGRSLRGIERVKAHPDAEVFFAGVGERDGKLINTGGRVFGVGMLGETREEAWEKAYDLIGYGDGVGIGSGKEDTQFRWDLHET